MWTITELGASLSQPTLCTQAAAAGAGWSKMACIGVYEVVVLFVNCICVVIIHTTPSFHLNTYVLKQLSRLLQWLGSLPMAH